MGFRIANDIGAILFKNDINCQLHVSVKQIKNLLTNTSTKRTPDEPFDTTRQQWDIQWQNHCFAYKMLPIFLLVHNLMVWSPARKLCKQQRIRLTLQLA